MYNHTPKDYQCPICLAVDGIESDASMIKQEDFFYHDNLVSALINSKFVGNNPGHVIIVPNHHYENIFDLPDAEMIRIFKIAKQIAESLGGIIEAQYQKTNLSGNILDEVEYRIYKK